MFVMSGGGKRRPVFLSNNSYAFFVAKGKKATFLGGSTIVNRQDCASPYLSFTGDFIIDYTAKYETLTSYSGIFTTADLSGYYTGGYVNEWGTARGFMLNNVTPSFITPPPSNVWVKVTIKKISSVLTVQYDGVTKTSSSHTSTVSALCPLVIGCTDYTSRGKFYIRDFTIWSKPAGASTGSLVFALDAAGSQIIDATGNHEHVNVPSSWGYGNGDLTISSYIN